MSKSYIDGKIVLPGPQPAGLARFSARKKAAEAAALAPYGIEKCGRLYYVTYEGERLLNAELTQTLGYKCYREYNTKREALEYINGDPDAPEAAELVEAVAEAPENAQETPEERPETISKSEEEKKGETTMKEFIFTAETMTAKGTTYPVEYSTSSNAVIVFVTVDGKRNAAKLRFASNHPSYNEALVAATEAAAAWKARRNAEKTSETTAEPVEVVAEAPEAQEAPEAAEPVEAVAEAPEAAEPVEAVAEAPETAEPVEAPADNRTARADRETLNAGKAPRGPVPEKTFIGQSIMGNGWKILFDADTSRTRIIFSETPTEEVKTILDAAGFYYSKGMDSWNKKLTFRAYRAAQAVSEKLAALTA